MHLKKCKCEIFFYKYHINSLDYGKIILIIFFNFICIYDIICVISRLKMASLAYKTSGGQMRMNTRFSHRNHCYWWFVDVETCLLNDSNDAKPKHKWERQMSRTFDSHFHPRAL